MAPSVALSLGPFSALPQPRTPHPQITPVLLFCRSPMLFPRKGFISRSLAVLTSSGKSSFLKLHEEAGGLLSASFFSSEAFMAWRWPRPELSWEARVL